MTFITYHCTCFVADREVSSDPVEILGMSVSDHITIQNCAYYLNKLYKVRHAVEQCFSTGGPRPSGGLC